MARKKKVSNGYVNLRDYIDVVGKSPEVIVNQIKELLKEEINVYEAYNVKARIVGEDELEANFQIFVLNDNICCLAGMFTTIITREEANWIIDGQDPELSTKKLFFAIKAIPKEFVKDEILQKKKIDKNK